MANKKYYKKLDLLRVICCIAILFYHFGILQGGYLAVCTFFVLSGFLSCVSAFQKEKFSFKDYYKKQFVSIYIPLLVTVFTTITVTSLFSHMNWVNLKPETTSILLGYNNMWQLSANLDYFTRYVASPFMHFWYISILIQFDIIFPFIFLGLKRLGDKIHKSIPCILLGILTILGTIYFYEANITQEIMFAYYHTLTRIFSLLLGMLIGFIYGYYHTLVPSTLQEKPNNTVMFFAYLLLLGILFFVVDAKSIYFSFGIIGATILSARVISYAATEESPNIHFWDKFIKTLSKISYEVYLLQYPVIFFFQSISMPSILKVIVMIIIILILSFILKFALDIKNKKYTILRTFVTIFFICTSCYGVMQYVNAKDHTQEMQELKEELKRNEAMLAQKQAEYKKRLEEEQSKKNDKIKSLELDEEEIKSMVSKLPVAGVGDSVMLGAIDALYETFPNGYFDAAISRTAWVANGILQNLEKRGLLGDPVVFNLGANGDCPESCKDEIMRTVGNRKVFWVNATNDADVHVNAKINALASKYSNVNVVDWESISKGHSEYFVADGIHLTEIGRESYSKAIYDAIYEVYKEDLKKQREQLIKEYEEELRNKMTFYGNDVLLSLYEYIQDDFEDSSVIINKDFNLDSLKSEIKQKIEDKTLTNKIFFAFDNSVHFIEKEYQELIDLCKDNKIYILVMNKENISVSNENVTLINVYQELQNHQEYYMVDKIHLTEEGSKAISTIILDFLAEQNDL